MMFSLHVVELREDTPGKSLHEPPAHSGPGDRRRRGGPRCRRCRRCRRGCPSARRSPPPGCRPAPVAAPVPSVVSPAVLMGRDAGPRQGAPGGSRPGAGDMGGPGLHRLANLAAVAVLAAGAVLWGVAPASAEIFDEPCYELGKQWVYEAKDMLLCDRSGRRININKFCKARLSAASGRLIIDSSKDDEAVETKKQVGHFPELCLPGQRSYAMQAPFLCTCVMHKGRHRWECVAPEGGAGRGLGGESPSGNRVRRHASAAGPADAEEHSSTPGHGRSASKPGSAAPSASASASTASSAEAHDDAHVAHDAGAHNGSAVMGRQAAPFRPNIVIDFCDEFGYVHTVSSTMRDCSCDKDVIATKVLSYRDNDLYHSGGLFATYECLPGTYNVRCEVCYPETHNCQPTACP